MNRLTDQGAVLSLVSKGELKKIRHTLVEVEAFLKSRGLSECLIGDINLVLAEAMTNIIRHGGLESTDEICLTLSLRDGTMSCVLVDTGVSFDPAELGHALPDPNQLKEGGYGWFIIRNLSQSIKYSRENGRNSLSFALPLLDVQ